MGFVWTASLAEPLGPRAAFPRLQHARWKILKRWGFHDFLPQFLLFFPEFVFLCKFSVKLHWEEMSAIGPHFASAGCDRGGEGGAAADAAAGKQRSGEHQRPQSHQHSSLSLPREPVAPRCSQLSWDGKRPIFDSTGRERHKAVDGPLHVCGAFRSWTGRPVNRARSFLSLHTLFLRDGPTQLRLTLWGISLGWK